MGENATREQIEAYELIRGEPFPAEPTSCDVLRARIARQLLEVERTKDARIAKEERRRMAMARARGKAK